MKYLLIIVVGFLLQYENINAQDEYYFPKPLKLIEDTIRIKESTLYLGAIGLRGERKYETFKYNEAGYPIEKLIYQGFKSPVFTVNYYYRCDSVLVDTKSKNKIKSITYFVNRLKTQTRFFNDDKVSDVVDYKYVNDSLISEIVRTSKGIITNKTSFVYDNLWLLIEEHSIKRGDTINSNYYKYNDAGNITEIISVDKKSKETKLEADYGSGGRVSDLKVQKGKKTKSKTFRIYNINNQLSELNYYDKKGKIYKHYEYEYDKMLLVDERYFYGKTLRRGTRYTYDNDKNLLKKEVYDKREKAIERWTWKYNEYGQLIFFDYKNLEPLNNVPYSSNSIEYEYY